jgi:hypothetical protein
LIKDLFKYGLEIKTYMLTAAGLSANSMAAIYVCLGRDLVFCGVNLATGASATAVWNVGISPEQRW